MYKSVFLLWYFFDEFFMNDFPSLFSTNSNNLTFTPRVNIRETNDSYIVDMAAPGMKKSDFSIHLDNKLFAISANLESTEENTNENFTRKEFSYSSFERRFTLPETVEEDKIKASYIDGIL